MTTFYHVGDLDNPRKAPSWSWEGDGLSVSINPDAWTSRAGLGGMSVYRLEKDNPKFYPFEKITPQPILDWCVTEGFLAPAGPGEGAKGYKFGPKGEAYCSRAFTGGRHFHQFARSLAQVFWAEAQGTYDGVMWNSRPKCWVIFQGKLPEWTITKEQTMEDPRENPLVVQAKMAAEGITKQDIMAIRPILRTWIGGGWHDGPQLARLLAKHEQTLAKFKPTKPVKLWRNERTPAPNGHTGVEMNNHGAEDQYTRPTAWSFERMAAETYASGIGRTLVTALVPPEDIYVSIPLVDYWCSKLGLKPIDEHRQSEMIVKPNPSFLAQIRRPVARKDEQTLRQELEQAMLAAYLPELEKALQAGKKVISEQELRQRIAGAVRDTHIEDLPEKVREWRGHKAAKVAGRGPLHGWLLPDGTFRSGSDVKLGEHWEIAHAEFGTVPRPVPKEREDDIEAAMTQAFASGWIRLSAHGAEATTWTDRSLHLLQTYLMSVGGLEGLRYFYVDSQAPAWSARVEPATDLLTLNRVSALRPYRARTAGVTPAFTYGVVAFTFKPKREWKDYQMLLLDVDKVEASYSKDPNFYVGPQGAGGIGTRYQRFQQWLEENPNTPIDPPFIGLTPSGSIIFGDGRHRWAVLRDMGEKRIPAMVAREDVKAMQEKFGVGQPKAAAVPGLEVRRIPKTPEGMALAKTLKIDEPHAQAAIDLDFLSEPGEQLLVAYLNGQPVGALAFCEGPDFGETTISHMGVTAQRQGIGRALIAQVPSHGAGGFYVIAEPDSFGFYEALGFQEDRESADWGQTEDGNKPMRRRASKQAKVASKTLYHGTSLARAKKIMQEGLEPQVGSLVQTAYGDESDYDFEPLAFAAEKQDINRGVYSAMLHAIEAEGHDTTNREQAIRNYGAVVVLKNGEDVMEHRGRDDEFDYTDHPLQVEGGDYYSREGLLPDYVITGPALVRFFKRNGGDFLHRGLNPKKVNALIGMVKKAHPGLDVEKIVEKVWSLDWKQFQQSWDYYSKLPTSKAASYEDETQTIKDNREKATKPHKFQAGSWTFPNGHPRCLICGDEETLDGQCPGIPAGKRAATTPRIVFHGQQTTDKPKRQNGILWAAPDQHMALNYANTYWRKGVPTLWAIDLNPSARIANLWDLGNPVIREIKEQVAAERKMQFGVGISDAAWDSYADFSILETKRWVLDALKKARVDAVWVHDTEHMGGGDQRNSLAILTDRAITSVTRVTPTIPKSAGLAGFNVNDSEFPWTQWILQGKKTIETRNSPSLSAHIGERVGIIRTGTGPATLVGYCVLGQPKVYRSNEEFRADDALHLVPQGSGFDIPPGGVKYGYPISNVEPCEPQRVEAQGRVWRRLAAEDESAKTLQAV